MFLSSELLSYFGFLIYTLYAIMSDMFVLLLFFLYKMKNTLATREILTTDNDPFMGCTLWRLCATQPKKQERNIKYKMSLENLKIKW